MLSYIYHSINGMIESECTLKTQTILRLLSFCFSLAVFFVVGCQTTDSQQGQESVKTSKQALGAQCYGDITQACATLGTSEAICNNQLTDIDCIWSEGVGCIAETNCDAMDEATCINAAASTAPIESCQWQTNSCHGSVNEACRVYGTSEESCNALPARGLHCQWVDNTCIVETDCEALVTEGECQASFSVASYCTWGAACHGNIWNACRQLASTQEECAQIADIGCAWFESLNQCLPSENCQSKNESACKAVEQKTYPIKSCSWGAQTTYEVGTCSGEPTQGARNTCPTFTTQESCESYCEGWLFASSICQWSDNACIVKETMCADQTNAMLCYSLTPSSYGFADCEWTPTP